MANEEKQPTEDRHDSESEYRSLGTDLGTYFLVGGATGAGLKAGAKLVDGTVEKVKDVLAPKDERPEIDLPPGAKK
jgi:hypothetical protein